MKLHGVMGAMVVLPLCVPVALARTWTDSSGKYTVEAEFVEFKDGTVRLQRADGKFIRIAIEKLSEADREFVRRQLNAGIDTEDVEKRQLLAKLVQMGDLLFRQEKIAEALCVYENALVFDPKDKELGGKIAGIQGSPGVKIDLTNPEVQKFFQDVFPKLDFNRDLGSWPKVNGEHDVAELRILLEPKAVGSGMFGAGRVLGGDPNVPVVFFVSRPTLSATDILRRFGKPQHDGTLWEGGMRALTYGRIRFLIDKNENALAVFRRMKVKD